MDTLQEQVLSVQANSFKFDNLEPATLYSVRMKVSNLVGESVWTEAIEATTGIEPSRPSILSFDSSTRTSLQLSWQKLEGADTGGSEENPLEITFYHLYVSDQQTEITHSVSGTESSYLVENL